jgi:hypothetical protein
VPFYAVNHLPILSRRFGTELSSRFSGGSPHNTKTVFQFCLLENGEKQAHSFPIACSLKKPVCKPSFYPDRLEP